MEQINMTQDEKDVIEIENLKKIYETGNKTGKKSIRTR